ncbi:MAG TPA: TonB-dependent receptor, partial [Bacteroidales bacterium]
FNPEIIKDFTLYKSGIPPRFGGRVSSIFDVTAKQGNLKKYVVSGGISPITGKATIEGPLIKDKMSFIISGRSTYSNWILRKLDRPEFKNSRADFYDIGAKISYDINKNNLLTITGYQSKDYFKLNSDTAYHYENKCARLFFKHIFSSKVYGALSAVYSNYQYNIASDKVPSTSFNLKYNISYKSIKTELFYSPNSKHTLNFGSEVIKYTMTPGDFTPLNALSDIKELKLPMEQGVETGLFINDEFVVSSKLTISAGLRYASFFVLGPSKVYEYRTDVSRSIDSRIDSTTYPSNHIVKIYGGPEVRLSARFNVGENNSVKLSYNRIHQFLHMVTNSSAISPTDVWKISDANIKPLIGDQVTLGYYHNLLSNTIEVFVEAYYKKSKDYLDYKSGAELLLNPNLDVDLLSGIGRAYGIEFFIKKKSGRLNGWISYTYSRTELKVDGKFQDEKINNGEYYPADYDKPHDFNIVANYRHSRRISLSNVFTYSTGRPITYPVAKYEFRGKQIMEYSNRNEYRIPDYMRWDLALNVEGNLKSKKLAHSSWSLGVYNLLGRKNVYSVFFRTTYSGVKGYQLSVFARPIVNLTYNFKF